MKSRFDFWHRKLAWVWLRLVQVFTYAFAFVWSHLFRFSRSRKLKTRIAAVWYCPCDLTGSNLRLGLWEQYFRRDGIDYDNYAINTVAEVLKNVEGDSWARRYYFFSLILIRRLIQLASIRGYDVVWLDRGFIPYFPVKQAFLERCLKRMNGRLVVDTTDGSDYQHNPELVIDTMGLADAITVGYRPLKKFYGERFGDHKTVTQINWTIPTERYVRRRHNRIDDRPIIGWMGQPSQAVYLKQLKKQFEIVSRKTPFILRYICRENCHLQFEGVDVQHYGFADDYYELLASFDIGLAPYLVRDLANTSKIGMKHQEFLICGVPHVGSPFAICPEAEDGVHMLKAESEHHWSEKISFLLNDEGLRERIAANGVKLIESNYSYAGFYPRLKASLLGSADTVSQ